MPASVSQSTVERVLNHCLSLDPYAGPHLQRLEGKVIEATLADSELSIRVRILSKRVRLEPADDETTPDVRVTGSVLAFVKMASDIRQGRPMFGSTVSMSGDVEVVQKLKTLLSELEIDWEEQLSRWLGDSAAHGIGIALREFHGWGRQTSNAFWLDVCEYLTEEKRLLPHPDEVAGYLEGVDVIRDDVERLIARVARLR